MEEKIVTLIMAAGASERLGQPKQLLPFKNLSFVSNAVNTAIESKNGPCVVVTGAHYKEVKEDLKSFKNKVLLCHNKEWEKGIGSSIQCGIKFINNNIPDVYGVIILLCDQPFIKSDFLVRMTRSHFTSRKKIIASGYGGSWGVPVFFHSSMFGYLEELEGDKGAKIVINRFKQNVFVIPNAEAEIDIDTMDDYKQIIDRVTK